MDTKSLAPNKPANEDVMPVVWFWWQAIANPTLRQFSASGRAVLCVVLCIIERACAHFSLDDRSAQSWFPVLCGGILLFATMVEAVLAATHARAIVDSGEVHYDADGRTIADITGSLCVTKSPR